MTNLTQKFSRQLVGAAMRVVTPALLLMVFATGAAHAQTRAYVSNVNDSTISVIDTATNTVVSNIEMRGYPDGIAVTPDGAFIYVLSRLSQNVLVISTATEAVVATVPLGVGDGPFAIAFGVRTQGPATKDQCKDGGWQTFTNPVFSSQGQCAKFVNQMNH